MTRCLTLALLLLFGAGITLAQPLDTYALYGSMMIPVHATVPWFGGTVTVKEQTITLQLAQTVVVLTLNSKAATVNGKAVTLDVPVTEREGMIYAPARFLRAALRVPIADDPVRKRVTLTHPTTGETITWTDTPVDEILARNTMRDLHDGKIEEVKRQVAQHPSLLYLSVNSRSLLMYALFENNSDLCQYLLARGATFREDDYPFHAVAVSDETIKAAEFLLGLGFDLNEANKDGSTPLHEACRNHQPAMVAWLIAHGADVNAATKWDGQEDPLDLAMEMTGLSDQLAYYWLTTPLMIALGEESPDIAKLLIEKGANLKYTVTSEHITLLHIATLCGNLTNVQLLVEKGMDINTATVSGFTPLHWASMSGKLEVAEWLLTHGAQVNATATVPDDILDKGTTVAKKLPGFGTPLMLAILNDETAVEELLLMHGAMPITPKDRQAMLQAFASACTQRDQMKCASNIRNVATACLMWAMEHKEKFPPAETVWKEMNVDAKLLACPGCKDRPNGFGYNIAVAGKSLNDIIDPSKTVLFVDCSSADNLIHTHSDIDQTRHGAGFIAAYCDGHVGFIQPVVQLTP